MPKKLVFFSLLCFFLCFSGCNLEEKVPPMDVISPTQSQSASTDLSPVFVNAISLPVTREVTYAEDGTEIFVNIYQNVELVLPDPQVADKVILALLNRIDTATGTAKDILTQAETNYSPSDTWQSYICRNIYSPTRLDNGVLSLFGQLTTFSGNAHAESVFNSVSYDLTTGENLALHNILLPHFDMDALKDAIKAVLAEQEEENYLYSHYPQVVDDRFRQDVLDDESWYFSQAGLCFYFSPYEIAPYASGVIVAEVPYEQLTGILENAYFPDEIPAVKGTMLKEPFGASAQEEYDSFWEISLEEGFQKILLHPDTTIYNVRLEIGHNDEEFIPEYTVFAASALQAQDAIIITFNGASTLSNLRVSYTSNNKTVYQTIS